MIERDRPKMTDSDNGSEVIGNHRGWLRLSAPASIGNCAGQAHAERLHRELQWRLRDKLLNETLVASTAQGSRCPCWRADYNGSRRHSQRGWRTPTPIGVRDEKEYFDDIQDVKVMLDLAKHIVNQRASTFEPEKFEDHYEAVLNELTNAKRKRDAEKRKRRPRKPKDLREGGKSHNIFTSRIVIAPKGDFELLRDGNFSQSARFRYYANKYK
jgi:hypothetical protein